MNKPYAATSSPSPIREMPKLAKYNKGDTLVIFGEVFERGYVNGLIQEAEKCGLQVIYSTVGRRDEQQQLRRLTDSEMAEKNAAQFD